VEEKLVGGEFNITLTGIDDSPSAVQKSVLKLKFKVS
jgi:hypothetical protein